MKAQVSVQRLAEARGIEFQRHGLDLSDKLFMVGKSEAVVGVTLNFPSAKPGKYRLILETTDAGSTEAAAAQTDIELVQQ